MMSLPPDPPPSKTAAILAAAVAEFQENGFPAASMDRISARAGVSKRTVYKRFASKELLFAAIVETMATRMEETLNVVFVPGRPIAEQLHDLAWAEGRLMMSPEGMGMFRVVLSETLRNPAMAAQVQARLDATQLFAAFLSAARDAGALDLADPLAAAQEFVGLIKARAFWPRVHSGVPMPEAEMAEVVNGAVAMMLARYAPSAAQPSTHSDSAAPAAST